MQGLGGEGPQLARQGEASRGTILGELWGPRGELLERHELGNLQRTQHEQRRETADEAERTRRIQGQRTGGQKRVGRDKEKGQGTQASTWIVKGRYQGCKQRNAFSVGKSPAAQLGAQGDIRDPGGHSRLQPLPSPGNTADDSKPNPEYGALSWDKKK